MEGPNARISLRDIVASDYLSSVNLQLNNGEGESTSINNSNINSNSNDVASSNTLPILQQAGGGGSSSSNGNGNGNEDGGKQQHLLHILNATKLALVLARAFVKLDCLNNINNNNNNDSSSSSSEENGNTSNSNGHSHSQGHGHNGEQQQQHELNLEALSLENFFLNFQLGMAATGTGTVSSQEDIIVTIGERKSQSSISLENNDADYFDDDDLLLQSVSVGFDNNLGNQSSNSMTPENMAFDDTTLGENKSQGGGSTTCLQDEDADADADFDDLLKSVDLDSLGNHPPKNDTTLPGARRSQCSNLEEENNIDDADFDGLLKSVGFVDPLLDQSNNALQNHPALGSSLGAKKAHDDILGARKAHQGTTTSLENNNEDADADADADFDDLLKSVGLVDSSNSNDDLDNNSVTPENRAFDNGQPQEPPTGEETTTCNNGNDNDNDKVSSSVFTMAWTMLGIDIDIVSSRSSTSSSNGTSSHCLNSNHHGSQQKKILPMQILGNYIQTIYSRGGNSQQFISSQNNGGGTTGTTIPMLERDEEDRRSPKLRTGEGMSLFTTLLETGRYPTSVCRLLADMMIDSGNHNEGQGQSSTTSTMDEHDPYTSFDHVIQDLEQMSNHPELFLYDQGNDFYNSAKLIFGQRCYGRTKELTKLLDVSTRIEQSGPLHNHDRLDGAQAVFVSGVAGSGKSHFVQNVGNFLTSFGWMVFKVKFKRDCEHGSREIVSSLFEQMVANLVLMKSKGNSEGSENNNNEAEDVDYGNRATEAISEELGPASLASLANFIPSLQDLITMIDKNVSLVAEADMSHMQLVFLLSKLLKAILSLDRRMMICLDDLQWCDSTMLIVIKEILINAGQINNQQQQGGRQMFLFVGMYRHDEVNNTESHPFANQLSVLRQSRNVDVTEIELSCLSREDVADMIMSEVRLPRRLVRGLANVVHKKTSGHTIFIVQFLNSLVRDSSIAYSPRKHRFDWDENKIGSLKTMDSVASLIVSNLTSLQVEARQSLRILSCFGVQIPLSLLKKISKCPYVPDGGIESYLPGLVEKGVVDISGPSVFFSHDLIQQHVYDSIPIEERRQLHIDNGTFIASEIELDSSLSASSIDDIVGELELGEANAAKESTPSAYPLVAIATNQINFAGPESVPERPQKVRFAKWNLRAGNDAALRSNFQAALYYYKSGLAFLGDDELWVKDTFQLCHELHEGANISLFAIGEYSLAAQQANVVIDHVPFEDSLATQYILIRAYDSLGRYADGVTQGLDILRKLKFDIPHDPSLANVMAAMAETEKAASAYSFNQITNTHQIVDSKKRHVFRIVESMVVSFFRSASPYLPLVGCAVVKYSLQVGVCEESAVAFMLFGYFKVALENKHEEGRYWGSVCLKILEGASEQVMTIRAGVMCLFYLTFFYYPFKESAFRQLKLYHRCMALGAVESALYALSFSLTLSFYGGDKLSLILNSTEELLRSMLRHVKEGATMVWLNKVLFCGLVGKSSGPFPDFGTAIHNEHSLLADAISKKNGLLMEAIHISRFNLAFWMCDYAEADKCSKSVLALPSSRMPKVQLVFHSFFIGLIAFHHYRDGKGESWLDEGIKGLDKMRVWVKNSTANFENKLYLLEAEHHASMCSIHAAKLAYEASIRSARDHGLVHEQGLACELYAKFLTSIIETDEAHGWFKCAHVCYMQWGATAKAEQVWNDNNLGLSDVRSLDQFAYKHGRSTQS